MSSPLHIVILAAGQGKRMRSALPKVLQPLAGQPLLAHVLTTARSLEPVAIHVVHGHGGEQLRQRFAEADDLHWVEQPQQLGTGHATQMAMPAIAGNDPDQARVLVMFGDCPLLRSSTLQALLDSNTTALLSAEVEDASGYGRIVRDPSGAVTAIVEHRDCSELQLAINEINSGILVARAAHLRDWLGQVKAENNQGEYYLTDVIALAVAAGQEVAGIIVDDAEEILGVNDRWQLTQLERIFQRRAARALCDQGALLADPERIDIRGSVNVGQDVSIDVNAVFEGDSVLGDGVSIAAGCVIKNCRLGPATRVHAHSVLDGVVTDGDCDIGPFARLRPGTRLAVKTRVGNFVETKKIQMGSGSKASHLSYVGDATIGDNVNIGAGTITCNYDGVNKHQTIIGDGAFIGSDSQLVAPVEIKAGATIGAGSTITKTAPADQLTLSRTRQLSIAGWKRPVKRDN